MLAVAERVPEGGTFVTIWRRYPLEACDGDCAFHPIACSDEEGISVPGSLHDVPPNLNVDGERWCSDCLVIP